MPSSEKIDSDPIFLFGSAPEGRLLPVVTLSESSTL
jgi:hypothetical protein